MQPRFGSPARGVASVERQLEFEPAVIRSERAPRASEFELFVERANSRHLQRHDAVDV